MFEDDFILRAVKQAAALLARALGLTQAGQHEQAQQTLEATYDELLGPSRDFLDSVDGTTLSHLVANVAGARVLAATCALDAALREQQGARSTARLRARQARELFIAARHADGSAESDAQLGRVDALLQRLAIGR